MQILLVAIGTSLLAAAPPAAVDAAARQAASEPDLPLGAFEGQEFSPWTTSGQAFGSGPYRPGGKNQFGGREGAGLAWSGRFGDEAQGDLVSPEFKIQRPFLNFLVAGGRDRPERLGVELLVDGQVVRSASATEWFSLDMVWRTWDVGPYAGRSARIRVNDHSSAGSIAVDRFAQSAMARAAATDAHRPLHETFRPQFHFTAPSGWLNDANGLLYYRGTWHLFHQHRPPESRLIVWGHATSDDLVHWRHRPTAVRAENGASAASGSGMIDWENASGLKRGNDPPILLAYTAHPNHDPHSRCTQCLAYSTNGAESFQNFAGNPILTTPATTDRDPKFFWHKPTRAWILVLSLSRNNTDREHATYGLFRSPDLKSWELLQEIGPGSWYWECPDMYELPVDGDPRHTKWLLSKGSGDYIIGSFDGRRFVPETEPIRTHWHDGYYGAQSFSDAPGGRRVQIGWMNTGKTDAPNAWPGMPFNQQMSFPRELRLCTTPDGPRLFFQPVAEIAKLYQTARDLGAGWLAPGENALAGIEPGLLDIDLEIELEQARRVRLKCRDAELSYDVSSRRLRLLRADPPALPPSGRLSLRVLIDRTSIEAFAQGGQLDVNGLYFPADTERTLTLEVEGGRARIARLVVRQLNSIWPE